MENIHKPAPRLTTEQWNAMTPSERFDHLYQGAAWKTDETCPLSGEGSKIENCHPYLQFIRQKFYDSDDYVNVIDFGCGDGTLMHPELPLLLGRGNPDRTYRGIDLSSLAVQIAREGIQRHPFPLSIRKRADFFHAPTPARALELLEAFCSPLTRGTAKIRTCNLILVKDVLQHTPPEFVSDFLDMTRRLRDTTVVITNDIHDAKVPEGPCPWGGYKPLNGIAEQARLAGFRLFEKPFRWYPQSRWLRWFSPPDWVKETQVLHTDSQLFRKSIGE